MASVLSDVEKRLVSWALDKANGNLAHAAELLGVPRSTLQYKANKLVADQKVESIPPRYPPTGETRPLLTNLR